MMLTLNILKQLKKNIFIGLMFMLIPVLILAVQAMSIAKQTGYNSVKLNIAVYKPDSSKEAEDLINWLKKDNNVTEINDLDTIKRKIFDQQLNGYINFDKSSVKDYLMSGTPLEINIRPYSFSSAFLPVRISRYLRTYKLFYDGNSVNYEKLNEALNAKVDVEYLNSSNDMENKDVFRISLAMLSYSLLSSCAGIISMGMTQFNKPNMKLRNFICPISRSSFRKQMTLAELIAVLVVCAISFIALIAFNYVLFSGKTHISGKELSLSAVYVLAYSVVCTGFVNITNSLSSSRSGVSMIMVSIPLILAMISGIFSDNLFIPEKIVAASKFFPLYHFSKGINEVFAYHRINFSTIAAILLMGIVYNIIGFTISNVKSKKLKF